MISAEHSVFMLFQNNGLTQSNDNPFFLFVYYLKQYQNWVKANRVGHEALK